MKVAIYGTGYELDFKKDIHPDIQLVTSVRDAEKVIVIGGDGRFLRAYEFLARENYLSKPLYGINKGTLGFLNNDPKLDENGFLIYPSMFNKPTHRKMLLDVYVGAKFVGTALNEVSIHSGEIGKLISLNMLLKNNTDEQFKAQLVYKGDGVIICTPTGSTAYNLSAGGSIIEPQLDVIAVTPMNPFSLSARPIIFNSNKSILIQAYDIKTSPHIVIDGRTVHQGGNSIAPVSIKRSKHSLLMIQEDNFFEAIHTKLGWNHSIK